MSAATADYNRSPRRMNPAEAHNDLLDRIEGLSHTERHDDRSEYVPIRHHSVGSTYARRTALWEGSALREAVVFIDMLSNGSIAYWLEVPE